ncbi:MAG: hypothetical protein Q8K32_05010 [Archangium sp.]|nr:hypothetical protein [Archangium sp.]MDP3573886.1 hypothetical protein [Archangium sp.]
MTLGGVVLALAGTPTAAATRPVGVHVVWLEGAQADRAQLDAFFQCLVGSSNLAEFWDGQLVFHYRGSVVVPADESLTLAATPAWVERQLAAGRLPPPPDGEWPVYLVYGDAPIAEGACGRPLAATVAGKKAGVAHVRVSPPCWPGTQLLRNETQIGMHELVETVDDMLGHAPCAADGACEGALACGDVCGNFTGLSCPGAPLQTFTGCDGTPVDGWVVQRLGRGGRARANCDACFACEFTVGLAGSPQPQGCGCAEGGGPLALSLLLLISRRRRLSASLVA